MLSCNVRARTKTLAVMLVAALCEVTMRAQTTTNDRPTSIRLPLEMRRGAAIIKVPVNDSKPLAFKLDTGFGVTTIHPELVESLGLKKAGKVTINGIAGQEEADYYSGATFDFGGQKYTPRRVAVIPSDAQRSRRARDGILGAGFFQKFVVELDFATNAITLHHPDTFDYKGKGEIIPLQFRRDTPTLEATYKFPDEPPNLARYELDSGCSGALCLGHDFVKSNRLDELTSPRRNGARVGVGGSVDTHEGKLPEFQIGAQKLKDVSANFFSEGSPAGRGMAGHIGMGVLREFKVILDYSRRRMILEPKK